MGLIVAVPSEYKRFKQSKELWKTVQEALYSSEVEQALWANLNITKPGWKFRDFRVQADAHGLVHHLLYPRRHAWNRRRAVF